MVCFLCFLLAVGDRPAERSAFVFPLLDLMIEAFQTELQRAANIHYEFLDK